MQDFVEGLRVANPFKAGWSQPEMAFLLISQILKAFLDVGYIANSTTQKAERHSHY